MRISRWEVINPNFKANVDSVIGCTIHVSNVLLTGWAFSENGRRIVEISALDEGLCFPASIGLPRSDVGDAFREAPEAPQSGFWLPVTERSITRTFTLRARFDGDDAWIPFLMIQLDPPPLGDEGARLSTRQWPDAPVICHHSTSTVRRRRIVVDGRVLNRSTTGTERYITAIIDHLRRLPGADGLEVRVLVWSLPPLLFPGLIYCVRDHLAEIRAADVFFKPFPANESVYLEEMAAARRCVFMPQDLILYSHPEYCRSMEEHLSYARFLKAAVHLADKIIAISDNGRQDLIGRMGVPPERVVRVHDGVQPLPPLSDAAAHLAQEEMSAKLGSRPFFLSVATNYPHKNLSRLIEAYVAFRAERDDVVLAVVGNAPYVNAKPMPICEGIVQLGHVSDSALQWLYANARALIFPSLYEGFGFPPLESMLVDVPVVASDASCIPEICGDAALFVNARSVPALKEALVRIHTDEALRGELIQKGRTRAAAFTWERTASATIAILLENEDVPYEERITAKKNVLRRHYAHYGFDRMLLFVTHVPFFPPGAGNELCIWSMLRHLKRCGYQLAVILTDLDRRRISDHQRYEILKVVDLLYEIQPGDEWFIPPPSAALQATLPNETQLHRWHEMERGFCPDITIAATELALRILRPRALVAQYIWFSRVLALCRRETLKVVYLHDKFSNKARQVTALGLDDKLCLTEEEERVFLNRADLCLAIQPEETRQFAALDSTARILTTGCAIERPANDASPPAENPQQVLIVASANPLNHHFVQWFVDTIWPAVVARVPSARLTIAGRVCSLLEGAARKAVELRGFVDDLDTLYAQAGIVVNPVFAGTGLKIKTIEAIAHGKAILAAPEGVAGLPLRPEPYFLVAHNEAEWVSHLVHLLLHEPSRQGFAKAAHAAARELLSPEAVYGEFLQALADAGITAPGFEIPHRLP